MATNPPTITNITDTFTTLVTNLNTISLDLGATGRLNTNQDSSTVAAINELELAIRGTSNNLVSADLSTGGLTATDLTAAIVELDSDIGARPHTTLTTLAKTLTGAINELHDSLGDAALTTSVGEVKEAINELDAELGTITAGAMGTTASTVSGAIAELEVEIDTLNTFVEPSQSLTTTATTLADAVNELDAEIGSATLTTTAQTLAGAINEHDTEIGAASLNTSATTLRGAINELHTELGAIPDSDGQKNLVANKVGESLRLLDSALGDLSTLTSTITDHSTIVKAINSNKAQIDLLDSDGIVVNQTLGSLSNLDSAFVGSERNNFVNALNALRADIPLIYDENGTQLN